MKLSTTIPDSEDDGSIGTSLQNSSPLPLRRSRRLPQSVPSKSQNTRVVQDSEDDDPGLSSPAPVKTQGPDNFKVVIPLKSESPFDSGSRSSTGDPSLYGATGVSTPATSVSAAPGESDTKKPRARVNASERAQQLRSSALSMGSSSRGTKRSAAAMTADEPETNLVTDEEFARAVQLREYDRILPKKQKRLSQAERHQIVNDRLDNSDLSGDELLDVIDMISMATSESDAEIFDDEISDLTEDEDMDNDGGRRAVDSRTPSEEPPTWWEQRKARRAQLNQDKLESKHPGLRTMWDDLKNTPVITTKEAEQPASITRRLKAFQLEGLNWLMEQEKTEYRGGLLGDEMGMGKTIQAVSLIMSDFPQKIPTLVVVPPVALMQWVSEIKEYTDGKLNVLVYHNSDSKVKKLTEADLRKYHVIMISYSSLESMYRKQVKGWTRAGGTVKEDSVIHAIDYHRLILDEAHSIKQRTTGVAKACFALNANYKWCLSGTPVQNRIGEFFSLLRFLQVRPFACYFCKECDCEKLQWDSNKEGRCTHCKHTGFNHVSIFNKEILKPITEGRTQKERKEGLQKLRLITDHIMLRRLKQEHTSSMELPPKRVILHNEFFGEMEHDFSRSIMTNSNRQFDTYVSRGVMLNNYANIFGLIMQMRQVANHPDLILKKHVQPGFNILVCRVCDEPAEDAIRSRCRHEFCRQCAKDYIRSFDDESMVDCPQCHIPLSIDLEQPTIEQAQESVKKNSIINRILMEDWTSSTKIEMLVYDLYQQRSKKHNPKSIIFSQFTSMLQLVEWRLRHAGLTTVMLDGTMTPAQRQRSIEHFMTNPDVEVFLVSLKAGGVALNLTEASRVFIVDPWWNPAAEWQSADRSHRIGQQRPCVITRLSIEDSVESRIVQLQEKKANLIQGTINKDQDQALEKLTPEDMQFLFRGN
ncbi:uncharacterized protein PFLUO_LOCUS1988 [Penicillium psychrofluorescens]|uniref:uncharacterized protein n=1 Tax=Penicillium psychrofluorescens TaxID=3158075 RepID=UPI003CCE3125